MLPDPVTKCLLQITQDNVSGASALAEQAASCFQQLAQDSKNLPSERVWELCLEVGHALLSAKPLMAPIITLVNNVLMKTRGAASSDNITNVIAEEATNFVKESRKNKEQMLKHGLALLEQEETILMHSSSSSIKALFERAHEAGKKLHIIITESCPGKEGKLLGEHFKLLGIKTTIIYDAAFMQYLPKCSKVLIGADAITATFFMNKIGTYPIVLGAKELGCPVFCLTQTTKLLPKLPIPVKSDIFEQIPLSSLTGIICDKGIVKPQQVQPLIEEKAYFFDQTDLVL